MHFDGCSFSLVAAKQTHVLSAACTRTSCLQVFLGEKIFFFFSPKEFVLFENFETAVTPLGQQSGSSVKD